VVAGSLAKMALPFQLSHRLKQIGKLKDMSQIDDYILDVQNQGNSVGGSIEITVKNMIVGIGEPFFNKLDAELAKLLFSVPAVKGVEFGLGFDGIELLGSDFNDTLVDEKGNTKTNNSGGITGGISNGNDLKINVFIKPTSSIQKAQDTYNLKSQKIETLDIGGRHDVAIVRRIGIILENVVAIGLLYQYLMHKAFL
jgi:chorismate synthase